MAVGGISLRVRHLNDARAGFVEPAEKFHDFFTLRGMQVAGRFVGQNQLGALNHSSRDSHELLLTAGELIWEEILFADDVEAVKNVANEADALFVGDIFVGERYFQVLEDRQVVNQVVALKNEADIGFVKLIALFDVEPMNRLAIEIILARPGAIKHPDDAQEGGLSGSRGAHKGDKLARLNFQRHAAQNIKLAAARFVNLLHVS